MSDDVDRLSALPAEIRLVIYDCLLQNNTSTQGDQLNNPTATLRRTALGQLCLASRLYYGEIDLNHPRTLEFFVRNNCFSFASLGQLGELIANQATNSLQFLTTVSIELRQLQFLRPVSNAEVTANRPDFRAVIPNRPRDSMVKQSFVSLLALSHLTLRLNSFTFYKSSDLRKELPTKPGQKFERLIGPPGEAMGWLHLRQAFREEDYSLRINRAIHIGPAAQCLHLPHGLPVELKFSVIVLARLFDESVPGWTTTDVILKTTNVGDAGSRWFPSPQIQVVESDEVVGSQGLSRSGEEWEWRYRSASCATWISQARIDGRLGTSDDEVL